MILRRVTTTGSVVAGSVAATSVAATATASPTPATSAAAITASIATRGATPVTTAIISTAIIAAVTALWAVAGSRRIVTRGIVIWGKILWSGSVRFRLALIQFGKLALRRLRFAAQSGRLLMLIVLGVVGHARLMLFARVLRLVQIDSVRLDSVTISSA